ncbi:hypothetical protein L1987_63597 [Smallanthus sonchifolius]|uniref:Uncharacterized protein n=1 Tax=Smallanthus sonchifolius TaxID=185202 RepID=A0ACB9CDL4_9ASTR|nr:hypothetical protein L1987_63597 [Smallanthus sonchifolius]
MFKVLTIKNQNSCLLNWFIVYGIFSPIKIYLEKKLERESGEDSGKVVVVRRWCVAANGGLDATNAMEFPIRCWERYF